LIGAVGRNVVVTAISADLIPTGQREEPPVPALCLYMLKHGSHYLNRVLGINGLGG
jgi:hypothetical protein